MNRDLKNVLVVETLMDTEKCSNPLNKVLVGPTNKTSYEYPASSASDSSIIFNNICAPSLSTVMRRSLRVGKLKATVSITCAGTTNAGYPGQLYVMNAVSAITQAVQVGSDLPALVAGQKVPWVGAATVCLRANPLASVITSADVRLNGGSTNCGLSDYNLIYPFISKRDDVVITEMPYQPDNSPVYENVSATSPFRDVLGNSAVQTRGSYVATLMSLTQAGGSANPMIAVYTVEWTEELHVSPFTVGKNQEDVGLVNVNNLTISLRLFSNLSNMLSAIGYVNSGAGAKTGPTFGVTFAGNTPALLVEFNSQNSILAQQSPQNAVYGYEQIQNYQTDIPNIAVGASQTVSLIALRLPCLPSKIYIFVAPQYGSRNAFISDHFLRITNVSVNFNDKNNLLASMNEASLFEMSSMNAIRNDGGYPTFNQVRYGCGTIVCIDTQRDLSVSESSAAGTQNQFSTLQVTLTVNRSNLDYQTPYAGTINIPVTYTAYQLVVSPGRLYLSGSQGEFVIAGPSPSEVLALTASDADKVPEVALPQSDSGAGFGSMLHKGLSFAWANRAAIADAAQKIHSAYNKGGDMSGGAISGGRLHKRA